MAPQPKRKSVGSDSKLKQGSLFSFFSKKPKTDSSSHSSAAASQTTTSTGPAKSTNAAPPAPPRPPPPPSATLTSSSTSSSSSSKDAGKKNASAPSTLKAGANSSKASSTSASAASSAGRKDVKVGDVIQVYWKDDDAWYTAEVVRQRANSQSFWLEYKEDGEGEWLDLGANVFRFVKQGGSSTTASSKRKRKEGKNEASDDMEDDDDDSSSASGQESSDYDDDASDDADEELDDDDQWMVTDDEDDNNGKGSARKPKASRGKKKAVAAVRVYEVEAKKATPVARKRGGGGSTLAPGAAVGPTPQHVTPALSSFSAEKCTPPALAHFSNTSPPVSSSSNRERAVAAVSRSGESSSSASRGTTSPALGSSGSSSRASPPMFVRDAVNPAGSHVHNHLKFLQNPKDAKGREPGDDNYDPRTLTVVEREWENVCGSKMTNAVVQWWDLKKQYFDTVLLFKTGKFYEMFHMDADIGVQVCDLSYMKGHVAHAGFPEISYATMADKLVSAGYKVARVEQTETPEQLQERKKRTSGPKPKVVNREVCSILTAGTRTCCYLDQHESFDPDSLGASGSSTGPLLAISEVLVDSSADASDADESSNGDDVLPVCEYGVTLVDALRGSVTVGQFADDVLRSRMNTLLATYEPSEILIRGGPSGASEELRSLLKIVQLSRPRLRIEVIQTQEQFPKSTAINPSIRKQLERGTVHPWDVQETLREFHRRRYYPQASKTRSDFSVARWPPVLKAAVEGDAGLLLSSLGAALFYLQRSLIDAEILSLGIVKAYIPPTSSVAPQSDSGELSALAQNDQQMESTFGMVEGGEGQSTSRPASQVNFQHLQSDVFSETTHMSLDGTTLHNLEVLHNSTDFTTAGSLWSVIDHTKTPHGSRLLRAWLLRPMFKKGDIDRRADAVQELVSGSGAIALSEAQSILSKCGDIERLLARVHSMSGSFRSDDDMDDDDATMIHPNERAVLYETKTYTKRKVADFSKLLHSLRSVTSIPEAFQGIDIQSGLLAKIVRTVDQGGCFPDMTEQLDWFYDNFDCDMAAKGLYEPAKGIDDDYDAACDVIERIEADLKSYRNEMCSSLLPRDLAKSSWKYINTLPDSKDKYLIELSVGVAVPDEFVVKGKRGTGSKQVNKYRTPTVESLVRELEKALEVQKERKARGMQLLFAKFDSMRALWASASTATALLDALGALAKTSSSPGYSRPIILEAQPGASSSIEVVQGRHPCVEKSLGPGNFVPNDLNLGRKRGDESSPRVLLLSGVNMGGKSTCLRQTCLIAILAQIGCFVPAVACHLTPIDRIFTRLGASDRILLGQSTFFVELAETAAALRGATPRSLVIMDELGRGTSTFDGTAIASAAILHLVERSRCLSLFATHYHSLLNEWQGHPNVLLGHMKCVVENEAAKDRESDDADQVGMITFLYLLGEGGCPKSFGINVARLARLPQEVIVAARQASTDFERTLKTRMSGNDSEHERLMMDAINSGSWMELMQLHESFT